MGDRVQRLRHDLTQAVALPTYPTGDREGRFAEAALEANEAPKLDAYSCPRRLTASRA